MSAPYIIIIVQKTTPTRLQRYAYSAEVYDYCVGIENRTLHTYESRGSLLSVCMILVYRRMDIVPKQPNRIQYT